MGAFERRRKRRLATFRAYQALLKEAKYKPGDVVRNMSGKLVTVQAVARRRSAMAENYGLAIAYYVQSDLGSGEKYFYWLEEALLLWPHERDTNLVGSSGGLNTFSHPSFTPRKARW